MDDMEEQGNLKLRNESRDNLLIRQQEISFFGEPFCCACLQSVEEVGCLASSSDVGSLPRPRTMAGFCYFYCLSIVLW